MRQLFLFFAFVLFISCSKANQPDRLLVDIESHEFGSGVESIDINIDANVAWEIISPVENFIFSQTQGINSAQISISTIDNGSVEKITENILIRKIDDDNLSRIIKLSQRGTTYILTPNDLSPLFLFGADNSSKTFTIDRAFNSEETSVNQQPDWLVVSKSDAAFKDTYTITAKANSGGERSSELIIYGGETVLKRVSIVQHGDPNIPQIILTLDEAVLQKDVNVGAKASKINIYLTQIPSEPMKTFKIRYLSGTQGAWWRLDNEFSSIKDEIWHVKPNQKLVIDENIGAERSVEVELYDNDKPEVVYKRFVIKQAASVDYFDLSAPSLNLDLWGNVYFRPYVLNVNTNKSWTIEKSYANWVDISYSNAMSGNIVIHVKKNDSGMARNTKLIFISNGEKIKEFVINQGVNESGTFDLKYELNLIITTQDDRFKYSHNNTGVLYVSAIDIFDNNRPANVDRVSKFSSSAKYGYVTDAPTSYNRVEARNLTHEYFYIPNYSGTTKLVGDNNTSLIGLNSISFFRRMVYYLPVPAKVKQDEIVVFTVVINNLIDNAVYDAPIITSTIKKQILL